MDLDTWFDHARRDAAEQGSPALEPLLDMLQRATRALRAADWAQGPDDGAEVGPPDTRLPTAAPDRGPDRSR